MIRYGILSTSSIAPRFIAGVRAAGGAEVVALSSRTLEKAREKAALWQIPTAYGSHTQLLEDANVDVVYISTVNAQHYPWAKAALEHGKHVVCEKPCTTSSEQTRELFRIAREKGLFFMEAEKMLFLPAVLEAKKAIREGIIGQIYMAELSHSFQATYNTWMFDSAAGGGPLFSSGIYAVQLIAWLFGPITAIRGEKSSLPDGVEWQYILTGQTESGVLFSAKNSTRAILDNTARIYGTKGYLELPEYWKARKLILHVAGQPPQVMEYPCQHELQYEAAHIRQCLEKGLTTSPVVTEEISVGGIAALERVREGWKGDKP